MSLDLPEAKIFKISITKLYIIRTLCGICGGRQLFLPVNLPKLKEDGYFRLTSSHLITGYMTTANTLFTDGAHREAVI